MAVTRISQSSLKQGLKKNRNFVAGIPPVLGRYYALSSVTVGAGGASSIEFTNIPQTYKHLQIRGFVRENSGNNHIVLMQINNDTVVGGNYYQHHLLGDGNSVFSNTFNNFGTVASAFMFSSDNPVDSPSSFIYDIFDYSNTSKNTVGRCFYGFDTNNTSNPIPQWGLVGITSTLHTQTTAVTRLNFFEFNQNFREFTTFSLYGVK